MRMMKADRDTARELLRLYLEEYSEEEGGFDADTFIDWMVVQCGLAPGDNKTMIAFYQRRLQARLALFAKDPDEQFEVLGSVPGSASESAGSVARRGQDGGGHGEPASSGLGAAAEHHLLPQKEATRRADAPRLIVLPMTGEPSDRVLAQMAAALSVGAGKRVPREARGLDFGFMFRALLATGLCWVSGGLTSATSRLNRWGFLLVTAPPRVTLDINEPPP